MICHIIYFKRGNTMDEKTVKASRVTTYLGSPYQTFNSWIKLGLFGERLQFPGRGSDRNFTFDDICLARIINEVLTLTSSFRITKEAVKCFNRNKNMSNMGYILISIRNSNVFGGNNKNSEEYLPEEDSPFPKVPEYHDGGKNIEIDVSLSKLEDGFYEKKYLLPGTAIMILPVDKIIEEVKRCFPKLVDDKK